MLRYTTDRARPGLVTLYDIRPQNGAGQFLQPGARMGLLPQNSYYRMNTKIMTRNWWQSQTCVPSIQETIKCSNSTLPLAIFGNYNKHPVTINSTGV